MPFDGPAGALACENLQVDLFDYFGENSPEMRTYGDTSFLAWLRSPQNTAGFERINVNTFPGKKRAVAFRVDDPYCFDLARTVRACTDPAGILSQSPKEIVFDMDVAPYRIVDGAGDPLELNIDLEDLEKYCSLDDFSWITKQISKLLMRFEEVLDRRMLELLETQVGTNKDGASISNIPLFRTNPMLAGVSILPEAMFEMNRLMRQIMVNKQYGIVGGQIVEKLATFLNWTTGDMAGVDISKMNPQFPYSFYDRNADDVLGIYDWLQMSPGAVQLVGWNKYPQGSAKRSSVTALYSNGTIVLPRTGIEIDWRWTYDPKCLVWKFEPLWYGDLAVVPSGGCGTPGVNGVIRVHDCSGNPLTPACPETLGL